MFIKFRFKPIPFILSVGITLLVGFLASFFVRSAIPSYNMLQKPPLTPPNFIFPIIWTILYVLIGIAAYLISISNHPEKNRALFFYFLQLFFNFLWPIVFFNFQNYIIAFAILLILIYLVICTTNAFYKINRIAAYLMFPYILWLLFAAYLNIGIYLCNG